MRSNAVACQRWQRRVLASMSGRAPAALATTMAASSGHLASMPAPRTAFAPGGLCAQGDRISVRNPIQMRARRGEVRAPPGGEGDGNGTRVRCPWPENGAIWWPQNWGHVLSGQQEWGPPGGPIFDPVFAPLAPPPGTRRVDLQDFLAQAGAPEPRAPPGQLREDRDALFLWIPGEAMEAWNLSGKSAVRDA